MRYVTRVEGCGVVEDWHYVTEVSVPVKWLLASDVRARAAIEFECTEDALEVNTLSHGQISVIGCGQRAIYVRVDAGWVMNTAGR